MSGFQTLHLKSELIRPWPYPFEAGLSIANDAEFMSHEFYSVLMEYLNTGNTNILGKGIGLPVSTSIFFFSSPEYNFTYFIGDKADAETSEYSESIVRGIRMGWIDTLHAYGDFDGKGGFTREHALRVAAELEALELKIPIYTNHGGVENIQNVGIDAAYHQGDVSGSKAYHSDLFNGLGVEYIWTDSLTTKKTNTEKQSKSVFSRLFSKPISRSATTKDLTQLFHEGLLQDGGRQKGFLRFRSTGVNAPNLSSFKYQLEQNDWQQFYQSNGALVIYQHLGVLHRINGECVAASIDDLLARPEALMSPFLWLKREMAEGRLWVERLAPFLRYCDMVESVDCQQSSRGDYIITSEKNWKLEELTGLTIYVDTNREVSILYRDKSLQYNVNGPDLSGRYSVTLSGK